MDRTERLQIVLTTAPGDAASRLAETLVSERLAACVNIVPAVRSVYRWNGEMQRDEESLLIAKVPATRFAAYRDRMRAIHPYEVPEIVALEAVEVADAYLAWCLSEAAG